MRSCTCFSPTPIRRFFAKDLAGGITLGLLCTAQSMAHASIATVPLIRGPYCCLVLLGSHFKPQYFGILIRFSERVQTSKFLTARRNHLQILRGSFPAVPTPIFGSNTAEHEPRRVWITDFADHIFRSHTERLQRRRSEASSNTRKKRVAGI